MTSEMLDSCPLCDRPMNNDSSVNRHHLIPKSFGGREQFWIHVVCHSKIHAVFTLRELLNYYHTFERIREHEEIQKFIKWVRKKEPGFRTRHKQPRGKRR